MTIRHYAAQRSPHVLAVYFLVLRAFETCALSSFHTHGAAWSPAGALRCPAPPDRRPSGPEAGGSDPATLPPAALPQPRRSPRPRLGCVGSVREWPAQRLPCP